MLRRTCPQLERHRKYIKDSIWAERLTCMDKADCVDENCGQFTECWSTEEHV